VDPHPAPPTKSGGADLSTNVPHTRSDSLSPGASVPGRGAAFSQGRFLLAGGDRERSRAGDEPRSKCDPAFCAT